MHTEVDSENQPCVLSIGTMTGRTIVCHLPRNRDRSCWDNFLGSFPQLAATLDHGQLIKVTSTFDATRRLLDSESVKYHHELVDLADIASHLLPEVEVPPGSTAPWDSALVRNLTYVWEVLGKCDGPVTPDLWRAAYGQSQPYPTDRDSDTLLRWETGAVSPQLTGAQRNYVHQLLRTGCILSAKFVQRKATGAQLRQPVVCLSKASTDVFAEQFNTRLDSQAEPQAQPTTCAAATSAEVPAAAVQKRVTFADPVEQEVERQDGDVDDDAIDIEPGSPIDGDVTASDAGPSRVMTRMEKVQANPFYDSDSDDEVSKMVVETSHSDDSAATREDPHDRDQIDAEPRHWIPQRERQRGNRMQRRPGERSIPYPRGFDLRSEQHLRSAINRERAEYRVEHPEEFRSDFLGSECCHLCGETPRHRNESECAVHYYRMIGRLPQQCTIPCIYCESPRHTTDACPFLHVRCSSCSFRGHMHFECKRRRTIEWLVAYLDCCHLGKLTRENREGPLRGRWGFGDLSNVSVPADVWELIRFKERSLKRFRKKMQYGDPGFNPVREAGLNWALVVRRHEQLRVNRL